MEEHKGRKTDAAAIKTDRISALPDDIIHQIIAHIDQDICGNPYNLSILSKRWNQILLSCPILKFDDSNLSSKQPHEKIAAAEACKKFFQLRSSNHTTFPVESVRIDIICWLWCWDRYVFLTGFLDSIFDLTAKILPREIHIHADSYVIPGMSLHGHLLCRLTVLHLKGCSFPDGISFEGLGISLKVLRLDFVKFPNDGMLDNMIACASRLETLELRRVNWFQVANHPNLKSISVCTRKLEIIGVRSLEILKISGMRLSCFRVSSTHNLKVLDIVGNSNGHVDLMKFIPEFPSLESIKYGCNHHQFNIINTNKLRQVTFNWRSSSVVEIDVLEEVDDFITCFLTILCKLNLDYMHLAALLAELSQFRVTLHITKHIPWNQTTAPAIEHLKFPSYLIDRNGYFLDCALQTCHPKFMSVTRHHDRMRKNDDQLGLQRICKQLVDRAQCFRCYKCWRIQLKDVKLITRFTNGDIREDEVIDVSEDMLSSLVEGDEVRFRLTWH